MRAEAQALPLHAYLRYVLRYAGARYVAYARDMYARYVAYARYVR
jgi:hypothetical protein